MRHVSAMSSKGITKTKVKLHAKRNQNQIVQSVHIYAWTRRESKGDLGRLVSSSSFFLPGYKAITFAMSALHICVWVLPLFFSLVRRSLARPCKTAAGVARSLVPAVSGLLGAGHSGGYGGVSNSACCCFWLSVRSLFLPLLPAMDG